jgi:hypothetical protein
VTCGEPSRWKGLHSGAVAGVAVACALAGGALGAAGLLLAQRRTESSASIDTPHYPRPIGDCDRPHQNSVDNPMHSTDEVCKVYFTSFPDPEGSPQKDTKAKTAEVDDSPPSMLFSQLQLDRTLPAIREQASESSMTTPDNSHLSPPFGVAPMRANGSSGSSGGSGHRAGTSTKPSEVPFGGVRECE